MLAHKQMPLSRLQATDLDSRHAPATLRLSRQLRIVPCGQSVSSHHRALPHRWGAFALLASSSGGLRRLGQLQQSKGGMPFATPSGFCCAGCRPRPLPHIASLQVWLSSVPVPTMMATVSHSRRSAWRHLQVGYAVNHSCSRHKHNNTVFQLFRLKTLRCFMLLTLGGCASSPSRASKKCGSYPQPPHLPVDSILQRKMRPANPLESGPCPHPQMLSVLFAQAGAGAAHSA